MKPLISVAIFLTTLLNAGELRKPNILLIVADDGIHTGQPIQSWQADAKTDPALAARIAHLFNRPGEELYDLQSDPYELKNLATDPALADIKARLQQELNTCMIQQNDRGLETEKLAHTRQVRSGKSEPKAGKKQPKKKKQR